MSETMNERRLADAVTKMEAALLTVQPELSKPYTDEPRLTPWDRFAYPAVQRLREAYTAHAAEVDALRKELEEVRRRIVEQGFEIGRLIGDRQRVASATEAIEELEKDLATARGELDEATKRITDTLSDLDGYIQDTDGITGDEVIGDAIKTLRGQWQPAPAVVDPAPKDDAQADFWRRHVYDDFGFCVVDGCYAERDHNIDYHRDPAPAAGDTAGQDGAV